jgi:hypothetical protein
MNKDNILQFPMTKRQVYTKNNIASLQAASSQVVTSNNTQRSVNQQQVRQSSQPVVSHCSLIWQWHYYKQRTKIAIEWH